MKTKSLSGHAIAPALLLLATLLSFGSCTFEDKTDIIPDDDGEDKTLTFSVRVPGGSTTGTYALTSGDESQVKTIEVLLFGTDGKYKDIRTVSETGITGSGSIKTFTVKIPEGTYSSLVVLANSRESVVAAGITESDTKESVQERLILTNSDKWITDNTSGSYKPIPMWGEMNGKTVDQSTSSATQSTPWELNLTRMLAKVSVALTDPQATDNFELQTIHLYNYYNKGSVAPVGDYWNPAGNSGAGIAVSASVPSGAVKPQTTTRPYGKLLYEGTEVSVTASEDEIYLFESNNSKYPNELKSRTCLVLGGYYKGDNTKLSYYRVDFVDDNTDKYLDILRNHHYRFNVTQINGPGYNSPDEAFDALPFNIKAKVIEWDDAEIRNMATDGQYLLGVSQMVYNLKMKEYTTADTDNKLSIVTDYHGGWKITSDADWLTLSQNSGEKNMTPKIISLILTQNSTEAQRTATLSVTAGNITILIKVIQSGEADLPGDVQENANSYIVAPNGTGILIPVSRANDSDLGSQLEEGETFNAHLVWTDKPHSASNALGIGSVGAIKEIQAIGTGPSGHILVVPGAGEGNAVIAVRNSSGKILWSWHIWVTKYDPKSNTYTSNGQTFMERNLGAVTNLKGSPGSMGLLYQWGRKDPFPASSSTTTGVEPTLYTTSGTTGVLTTSVPTVSSPYYNLGNSILNPLTFYTKSHITPYDWYNSGSIQNNYLWGADKTVYDPCPTGWRVPTSGTGSTSPWYGLSSQSLTTGTGADWTSIERGYYPAAGCRNYAGGFAEIGTDGSYWSASPSGEYGSSLSFSNNSVRPSNQDARGRGNSMRCVKYSE